jgi:hypothetical protein
LNQIQRVLAQGNFDGLCLIYSIFNAYKALKHPEKTASQFIQKYSEEWKVVIRNTPSLHNFVLGEGSDFGIETDEMDVKIKRSFIKTSFDVMTDGSLYSPVLTAIDIESLKTMDFTENVAVLCVKKSARFEHGGMGEHWVAIVGRDDVRGKYLVACSNTLLHYGFKEEKDNQSGRYFNTSIDVTGIMRRTVYSNNISQIHISKR